LTHGELSLDEGGSTDGEISSGGDGAADEEGAAGGNGRGRQESAVDIHIGRADIGDGQRRGEIGHHTAHGASCVYIGGSDEVVEGAKRAHKEPCVGDGGLTHRQILLDVDVGRRDSGDQGGGDDGVLNIADAGNANRTHIDGVQIRHLGGIREGEGVGHAPDVGGFGSDGQESIGLGNGIEIGKSTSSINESHTCGGANENRIRGRSTSKRVSDSNQ
jgi:hypothetical protein